MKEKEGSHLLLTDIGLSPTLSLRGSVEAAASMGRRRRGGSDHTAPSRRHTNDGMGWYKPNAM